MLQHMLAAGRALLDWRLVPFSCNSCRAAAAPGCIHASSPSPSPQAPPVGPQHDGAAGLGSHPPVQAGQLRHHLRKWSRGQGTVDTQPKEGQEDGEAGELATNHPGRHPGNHPGRHTAPAPPARHLPPGNRTATVAGHAGVRCQDVCLPTPAACMPKDPGQRSLTPCTTIPWLTVSGKSTACATSHGTPEASSCDTQNAGLLGLLQPAPGRVDDTNTSGEVLGNVALRPYTSGRSREKAWGASTASSQTSSCCAVVATAAWP